ncbi:outer membrane lipoprotein-sorting protein [Kiloniella laminariae]|uniref:outer membrane lipoprotein-sorting protein n=1 Tax=Kiloniella laminariae TaxID=454162 RepID=UPI000372E00E|nr:outer membrane lipoprotein-sorting protein [Kiloniella laminariae]
MNKILLASVFSLSLAVFAGSLSSAPALADNSDPVAKGTAVAEEWDRRDQGFGDSEAIMKMELENRHGEKSLREMRQQIFEIKEDGLGDKSLTIFDEPRDVKGTAFLSFAKTFDPDDQWLYLPALKRVKRISSKNKSGPFVGSEFAYEDLSAQELKKYTYTWLRDEACGELQCAVVEQIPVYEDSGYTRMVTWYDLSEYRQQKIDYYDRKNELLKTLNFGDYRQYLDKYWRSHDMFMVNHQTGKKTRLVFEKIEFQTGLQESDLTKNSLKRVN